jgi:hypothetical protein
MGRWSSSGNNVCRNILSCSYVKKEHISATILLSKNLKREIARHLFPGNPSEYLLVRHEPTASITARDVKFSEAISSKPRNCRRFSHSMMACTSGSRSCREGSVNFNAASGQKTSPAQCLLRSSHKLLVMQKEKFT